MDIDTYLTHLQVRLNTALGRSQAKLQMLSKLSKPTCAEALTREPRQWSPSVRVIRILERVLRKVGEKVVI